MKLIKSIENITSVITLVVLMLISVNTSAQNTDYSKKQISEVKVKLNRSMSYFVESVKPFYKKEMSFEGFKTSLIGTNTGTMTKEGNDLLIKAFHYLKESVSTSEIIKNDSGEEMARAIVFVRSYNKNNKTKNGDYILFGNSTGDTFPDAKNSKIEAPCKWYQIGCWWNLIFGDYSDEIFQTLLVLLLP